MREFYEQADKEAVAGAKQKYRGRKLADRHLDALSDRAADCQEKLDDHIHLRLKNGQWQAIAGTVCVIDDAPEAALRRLMTRLHFRGGDKAKRMRLYQSIVGPSCEIVQFEAKSDLGGNLRYVVDFTTNVRLCRGDVEGLFCAMMRSALGTEARFDEEESQSA